MGYQVATGASGAAPINIYPPGTVVTPDSNQLDYVSTGPLSSPRVVYAGPSGLDIADKDSLGQQDRVIGVTKTSAAAAGETVKVVTSGNMVDPSFSFTPGPIWLSNSGLLTQVRPTSGLVVQIAVAISATQIEVNIQMAIRLA